MAYLRNITFAPGREGVVGRVLLERKPVQITDVLADPDYRLREIQRLGGFRTHLGLPLLREADLIGILLVSRDIVQPFDDQHPELLTTFADQAVIAIENTRLFEAGQQRTRELSESLEQQTATSEILQVISFRGSAQRSPRHPSLNNPPGRMIATKTVVHFADVAAEQAYIEQRDPETIAAVKLGHVRTFLASPC
jgi:signal transduction protein with GAF and PtsI domain